MAAAEAGEPILERVPAGAQDVAVLRLEGELDLSVSGRLRELVDGVVAEGPRLAVIDVTAVGFMDSTMLRELLRAHRETTGTGARLVLAGAQPPVSRLLELTGTAQVFTQAGSLSDALASEADKEAGPA